MTENTPADREIARMLIADAPVPIPAERVTAEVLDAVIEMHADQFRDFKRGVRVARAETAAERDRLRNLSRDLTRSLEVVEGWIMADDTLDSDGEIIGVVRAALARARGEAVNG